MYLAMIVLLMLVLTAGSVLAEKLFFASQSAMYLLIGKWFVFWAVGLRMLTAGLRQAVSPRFTAEGIFGIDGEEPCALSL